jgi:hypothetical protein
VLGAVVLGLEPVVVEVEASVEPPHRVENEGADEGGGRVAVPPEDFGQRRWVRAQPSSRQVFDAVPHRVGAGQNGGVRGQSQRHLGNRPAENDTVAPQRVHARSQGGGASVGSQPVGAESVDGDQDDIRLGLEASVRRGGAPGGDGRGEQQRRCPLGRLPKPARPVCKVHFDRPPIFINST